MVKLKQSLKQNKILKVNSIDDDRLKIKKTNNGQGAALQPDSFKRDETIEMYQGYLNKLFM